MSRKEIFYYIYVVYACLESGMVRASWCSAHLSQAQVPALAGSSVQDRGKKGDGVRGGGRRQPDLAGTREYEQSDWGR